MSLEFNNDCACVLLVPVEISFERSSYSFHEGSGQVEVCILANFRNETRPFTVTVSETSITAKGK